MMKNQKRFQSSSRTASPLVLRSLGSRLQLVKLYCFSRSIFYEDDLVLHKQLKHRGSLLQIPPPDQHRTSTSLRSACHHCAQSTPPVSALLFLRWTAVGISRDSQVPYGITGWNTAYKGLDVCLFMGLCWCAGRIAAVPSAGLHSDSAYLQETLLTHVSLNSQSYFQIWAASWFKSYGREGNRCSMLS